MPGGDATAVVSVAWPHAIPWAGRDDADRLLAEQPFALLVGFVLDQQVTVQKAFTGPLVLQERLGHLDPARIAAMELEELQAVVAARPALHRFPAAMAGRIQALAALVQDRYHGRVARLWEEASDGRDLLRRLSELPGFGPLKVGAMATLLHRRYGVDLPGLEELLPDGPTLGEVDSPEALAAYQADKRARKAGARADAAERGVGA